MGRFYVPKEFVNGNIIVLGGAEAHHILAVMRLKRLDRVVVFDGTGNEYFGFIKDIEGKTLTVEITEKRKAIPADDIDITLIQAIPKKDRMDYIVEKATELGARSVIPVFTERTIPDWDSAKKAARVERWRKIAKEASKQCGRADIPEITRVMEFHNAVKNAGDRDLKLIAALSDEAVPIRDALATFVIRNPSSAVRDKGLRTTDNGRRTTNIVIAIGPEGDFTGDEVVAAKGAGFKVIGLGTRVLKSDTAAIAVLSILNYEFSKS
ncbi:MAG: 16S rRNA (uracil(1498)-N(3))-methyltransferase [Candidatus Omnitrophota bacterium]|nr:16S rRNA (uracil(1498)-N(3))-methyltransferase [Candidatus Omnitrophota bacterium]